MADTDLIRRSEAIEAIENTDWYHQNANKDMVSGANPDEHQAWYKAEDVYKALESVPSTQPEGYIKIPETGIDDLSDGFHTFRQLYYQRMMLFATIVKQNKDKAWKSLRHEDGEPCFGGGWFIVGIDTPEGSYTYHYEDNYFSLFDCEELERGKHWDGHTEKDVARLLSLPSAKPERMTNREDLIRQVNYVIFKLNDLRIIAYKLSRDIDDEMNDLGEIKSELEKYYDDKINKMNRYEHGK